MQQDRLFYVAPEQIHVGVFWRPHSSSYAVRVSVSSRGPDGAFLDPEWDVYEDLGPEEALDVATGAVAHLLFDEEALGLD